MSITKYMERYDRQIRLNGFGLDAQRALTEAKVLVVGAGGLGCPVLQYLVAAGVGHIGIVDDDIVSIHNLQRQVLYDENDAGNYKALAAAKRLSALNSSIELRVYRFRLTVENCIGLLSDHEIIIDCTDNFETRYLLNDACVLTGKALVYGAVSRYEGQVCVLNAPQGDKYSANYRDLFPHPPSPGEVPDCAEAGVLGVLPGIIGSMQAAEAIKLITGIGKPLIEELLTYNIKDHTIHKIKFSKNPETGHTMPDTIDELLSTDYSGSCALPVKAEMISAMAFDEMISAPDVFIVDCRETDEIPAVTEFVHIQLPASRFTFTSHDFTKGVFVFFCQSGKRSQSIADKLCSHFGTTERFFSLENGIMSWKSFKNVEIPAK